MKQQAGESEHSTQQKQKEHLIPQRTAGGTPLSQLTPHTKTDENVRPRGQSAEQAFGIDAIIVIEMLRAQKSMVHQAQQIVLFSPIIISVAAKEQKGIAKEQSDDELGQMTVRKKHYRKGSKPITNGQTGQYTRKTNRRKTPSGFAQASEEVRSHRVRISMPIVTETRKPHNEESDQIKTYHTTKHLRSRSLCEPEAVLS